MNTQPHNDPLTASLASAGGHSGITGGLFDLPEVVKKPNLYDVIGLRSEPTPVTPRRTPLHLQEPFVLREGFVLENYSPCDIDYLCLECGGLMRSCRYKHPVDGFLLIHHCAGAFADVPTCHYRRTP